MTALDDAQSEWAAAPLPPVEFLEEDVTPPTALYWVYEAVKLALPIATGYCANLQIDETEEQPVLTELLNGVSFAVAGMTHAMVALEMLPQEAEDALTTAP